jgi:hypothetical protein
MKEKRLEGERRLAKKGLAHPQALFLLSLVIVFLITRMIFESKAT